MIWNHGGIGRAFKEGSEIRTALKDYDYDGGLAADRGLTRAELDSTLQELTGEVYRTSEVFVTQTGKFLDKKICVLLYKESKILSAA